MIADFLLDGKRNAISSQRLADLAGCKSVRELQQVISENTDEVKEFIRTLESRGRNTLAALKSAKNYLKSCGDEVDE